MADAKDREPGDTQSQAGWLELPLFVRDLGAAGKQIYSAHQVRQAVAIGRLEPGTPLTVHTFPHRTIRTLTARDVLSVAECGAPGLEKVTFAALPSPPRRYELAPPAGGVSRAPPPPTAEPAPQTTPDASATAARHATSRLLRQPPWRSPKLWGIAGLAYSALGIAFYFFVTVNPQLSVDGVGWGLFGASFKTALALFGVFMWAALLLGRTDSDAIVVAGTCLFVGGVLVGATHGYVAGYAHLRANQFAPIDVLIDRCMEDGIVTGPRVGAICSDGRSSRARGHGACSHHGGVTRWKYKETQTRTPTECRAIAQQIKWY